MARQLVGNLSNTWTPSSADYIILRGTQQGQTASATQIVAGEKGISSDSYVFRDITAGHVIRGGGDTNPATGSPLRTINGESLFGSTDIIVSGGQPHIAYVATLEELSTASADETKTIIIATKPITITNAFPVTFDNNLGQCYVYGEMLTWNTPQFLSVNDNAVFFNCDFKLLQNLTGVIGNGSPAVYFRKLYTNGFSIIQNGVIPVFHEWWDYNGVTHSTQLYWENSNDSCHQVQASTTLTGKCVKMSDTSGFLVLNGSTDRIRYLGTVRNGILIQNGFAEVFVHNVGGGNLLLTKSKPIYATIPAVDDGTFSVVSGEVNEIPVGAIYDQTTLNEGETKLVKVILR
jgi:hypothetical protein